MNVSKKNDSARLRVSPFGVSHSMPTLLARAMYEAQWAGQTVLADALEELHATATARAGIFADSPDPEGQANYDEMMSAIEHALPIRFVENRPLPSDEDANMWGRMLEASLPEDRPVWIRFVSETTHWNDAVSTFTIRFANRQAATLGIMVWAPDYTPSYWTTDPTEAARCDDMFRLHGPSGDPTNYAERNADPNNRKEHK